MELAIINGTYRDSSTKTAAAGNISHNMTCYAHIFLTPIQKENGIHV